MEIDLLFGKSIAGGTGSFYGRVDPDKLVGFVQLTGYNGIYSHGSFSLLLHTIYGDGNPEFQGFIPHTCYALAAWAKSLICRPAKSLILLGSVQTMEEAAGAVFWSQT